MRLVTDLSLWHRFTKTVTTRHQGPVRVLQLVRDCSVLQQKGILSFGGVWRKMIKTNKESLQKRPHPKSIAEESIML